MTPGFKLVDVDNDFFSAYTEANIDAPQIWHVFETLSRSLSRDVPAELLFGLLKDEEPEHVGAAHLDQVLDILRPHRHQLANDGCIQFGWVQQDDRGVTEILLARTKHFGIWNDDARLIRDVFGTLGIMEADELEYLDQFPRITTPLSGAIDGEELLKEMKADLGRLRTLFPG